MNFLFSQLFIVMERNDDLHRSSTLQLNIWGDYHHCLIVKFISVSFCLAEKCFWKFSPFKNQSLGKSIWFNILKCSYSSLRIYINNNKDTLEKHSKQVVIKMLSTFGYNCVILYSWIRSHYFLLGQETLYKYW